MHNDLKFVGLIILDSHLIQSGCCVTKVGRLYGTNYLQVVILTLNHQSMCGALLIQAFESALKKFVGNIHKGTKFGD